MRLFKSNKSEDRLSGSREGSPQSEGTYPATHHRPHQHQHQSHGDNLYTSQPDPRPDRYSQQQQQPPFSDSQYQIQDSQTKPQTHPAQHLSRSQSGRIPSAGEVYGGQRHSVNLPPPPPQQLVIPEGPTPIPGQTSFGQSKHVRVEREKEPKRSKRSFIPGFGKDKSRDEDRDRDKEKENNPSDRKHIGRSSSVHLLRKSQVPDQPSRESYVQQTSPQYQNRQSAYYPPSDAVTANTASDQSRYEAYQQTQGQFDSPQSQTTHQSIEYAEDAPQFSPDREQYQAYQQTESANTSEQHLPFQGKQLISRPSNIESDPYQHLRPPSQASLGPPSPIVNPSLPPAASDSRPSTAATNRYSAQSAGQGQQQPPQSAMARGDPPNGSLRQQIPQRETRPEEHPQYPSQQDPRVRMSQQVSEQGRSTPPPRSREDISQLDYHQLLQRHEELQAKYSKVKRYYFDKENQVTQLQNTVANQRLSMSKTSLDDAQYTSRFERLSGAINNLSFNIRKDWRAVPPWLRHVCNQDAHTVGMKEMTAVGRACITRWLYESIFERTFHPGIDPSLSAHLKNIERNLRRSGQAGMPLTDEQRDDLTAKITTWRLTTIEGLQDILASSQAEQYTEHLTKILTHQLTESLKANLTDPPPPGLSEGVNMIVGQAIGIVANIPLESRDICIEYFMPGTPVNETYMKVEPQMTPLVNPGPDERLLAMQAQAQPQSMHDTQEGDGVSTASADDGPRDRDVEAEIREAAGKAASQQPGSGAPGAVQGRNESVAGQGSQTTIKNMNDKQPKKSFLGGIVGKKPSVARSESRAGAGGEYVANASTGNNGDDQRGNVRDSVAVDSAPVVPGANEGRIRFAIFLAVEVRGKGPGAGSLASTGNSGKEAGSAAAGGVRESSVNVLFKAPVYEY